MVWCTQPPAHPVVIPWVNLHDHHISWKCPSFKKMARSSFPVKVSLLQLFGDLSCISFRKWLCSHIYWCIHTYNNVYRSQVHLYVYTYPCNQTHIDLSNMSSAQEIPHTLSQFLHQRPILFQTLTMEINFKMIILCILISLFIDSLQNFVSAGGRVTISVTHLKGNKNV